MLMAVPTTANGLELMPVIRLLGGESRFSPAAGTYLISIGDHLLTGRPKHRVRRRGRSTAEDRGHPLPVARWPGRLAAVPRGGDPQPARAPLGASVQWVADRTRGSNRRGGDGQGGCRRFCRHHDAGHHLRPAGDGRCAQRRRRDHDPVGRLQPAARPVCSATFPPRAQHLDREGAATGAAGAGRRRAHLAHPRGAHADLPRAWPATANAHSDSPAAGAGAAIDPTTDRDRSRPWW